jgi:hypothetical protein
MKLPFNVSNSYQVYSCELKEGLLFLQVKNKPQMDCKCRCIYHWSFWHEHK